MKKINIKELQMDRHSRLVQLAIDSQENPTANWQAMSIITAACFLAESIDRLALAVQESKQ